MAKVINRYLGFILVTFFLLLTLTAILLPKDNFQLNKEKLIVNPEDYEARLQLAEKLLVNNQFTEAEKVLGLAQLGEKSSDKLDELRQKKRSADPQDIRRLIIFWEKFMEEKPDYRDGWLQLAFLHYRIFENEKAKEFLQKAFELDPNYEPTRKLEKIIGI